MPLLCEVFAPPCPADGTSAGPRAVAGPSPESLLEILHPAVNLAIWSRETPPTLRRALSAMVATPFRAIADAAPEAVVDALSPQLPAATPAELLLDIHGLAIAFATIAGQHRLRARLDVVTDDSCHRFHADAVGLRLLCTYRGTGTQWLALPGGAATARGLGPAPPVPPQVLGTGAAAILKGEAHPGHAGRGCIHRSPPMPPGAPARLLLCLDEAVRTTP